MFFEKYINGKSAFVFGLDDVVYPQKDYLLQVYYLFSEFLSYTEQFDASRILEFMKQEYEKDGAHLIFEKTAKQFDIPEKYSANFQLLHQNARLPLKLLLFKNVLDFLQEIVLERKAIFLLVDGDPVEQLNKIRQTEWHGLEKYLKLYFTAEFGPKPATESIDYIMQQHALTPGNILLIGDGKTDENFAAEIGVEYLAVAKLL